MWLVQDLANIFVFLPRQLGFFPMLISTLVLYEDLFKLYSARRAKRPIFGRPRRSTSFFDLCLLCKPFLSRFALSTTWVFLGLLGGREIDRRIKERDFEYVLSIQESGTLAKIINDHCKAAIGVVVSLLIALSTHPLAQFTAG